MLEKAVTGRNSSVDIYHEQLGQIPGVAFQEVRPGNRNSYKDFSITIDPEKFGLNRDEVAQALAAENIDTRNYYEPPVHRQTAYAHFAQPSNGLYNSALLSERSLSLPVWSNMDEETVFRICRAVRQVYESAEQVRAALM
jgi:dTDP-4-amino-4,6-dideoxygalactose transaminase